MNAINKISGIASLAENYDALLCDAWGVIHNGVELFPGAQEALVNFRNNRGPVIVLTNAPRPAEIIPPQLDRLGLPRGAYDGVVTSGDATRAEIEKRLPAPAFRIGPEKDEPLFDGLDINFTTLEKADFIICTGLVDDQREEPEAYRGVLKQAAMRNLEMVCANPDIVVNWGGRMIWCAGALAEIYAELGGPVIFGGKPHPPIYELAIAAIEKVKGSAISSNRILAIGDGLNTDILGANKAGIDALLVAGDGGIHGEASDTAALEEKLRHAGASIIAVTDALTW